MSVSSSVSTGMSRSRFNPLVFILGIVFFGLFGFFITSCGGDVGVGDIGVGVMFASCSSMACIVACLEYSYDIDQSLFQFSC